MAWLSTNGGYTDEVGNAELIREEERVKSMTFYMKNSATPYAFDYAGNGVSVESARQVSSSKQFGQKGTLTEVTVSGTEADMEQYIADLRAAGAIY